MLNFFLSQIFSKTVSNSFKSIRQQGLDPEGLLENCEATGEFSETLNDFFDLLDKKIPETGVRRHNLKTFNEVIVEKIFSARPVLF